MSTNDLPHGGNAPHVFVDRTYAVQQNPLLGGLGQESSPPAPSLSLTIIVSTFLPLAIHRMLESVFSRGKGAVLKEVARHTLPPLGMLGSAIWLIRACPPWPGADRHGRSAGHRGLAIAAGLMLGTLAAVVNLLSIVVGNPSGSGSLGSGLDAGVVALVMHVAFLAPVAEEAAFRGLLYRRLRQVTFPLAATLLSATIFAVMHASMNQACWAFLLGLVAAFSVEQTRSLLSPILIHGLFNAVPLGVAMVQSRPGDTGPLWLVIMAGSIIFTLAASSAQRIWSQEPGP